MVENAILKPRERPRIPVGHFRSFLSPPFTELHSYHKGVVDNLRQLHVFYLERKIYMCFTLGINSSSVNNRGGGRYMYMYVDTKTSKNTIIHEFLGLSSSIYISLHYTTCISGFVAPFLASLEGEEKKLREVKRRRDEM